MKSIKIKLKQLFISQNGDTDIKQEHINNKGVYVCSSGEGNFGIIGKSDIEAKIIKKNSITVDMFGCVYYRDFDYKLVTHARIFTLEGDYSKNTMLYIAASLKNLKFIYSFNNMCSWKKIQEHEIELPSSDGINPDYEYMESFISGLEQERISELEQERISELDKYLKATGLNDYKLENEDINILYKKINTKSFKISDLFDIKTGRDVIINTLNYGDIPLISHQCNNNGITKYINNLSNRILFNHKSTIPLADRGVFHASCQTKDFYIGTRVKALIFKDGDKTEKQRLYFVNIINRLQEHFSDYLTNATDKLPELVIILPIKFDGTPDYEYMEKYITAIEKLTIKDVVEYKDKVINIIKQIK